MPNTCVGQRATGDTIHGVLHCPWRAGRRSLKLVARHPLQVQLLMFIRDNAENELVKVHLEEKQSITLQFPVVLSGS